MPQQPQPIEESKEEIQGIEQQIPQEEIDYSTILNPENNVDTEVQSFKNYAITMSEERLKEIEDEVSEGYENDFKSLQDLFEKRKAYKKLTDLCFEVKNTPWPNASNIKLPIITTACVNFQSRCSSALLPANKIANALPLKGDEETCAKSLRVQKHINYQLTYEMKEFYASMDKTLMLLPMDGFAFRKVYFDSTKNRVVSLHVLPEDFIVDAKTRSLEDCYRYSQRIFMNPNDIRIKQEQGLYKDIPEMLSYSETNLENMPLDEQNKRDDVVGYRYLIETHTYLSLDKEKIKVPVIITWDYEEKKVVRIVKRENPKTDKQMNFFVNYEFIPNPESIFGYGFGPLLFGITHSMNTAINQLLDAGHLSNTKGGFFKRTSKMSRGIKRWVMGVFSEIDSNDDDIRKSLMPLEFSPPSSVLITLLEYLSGYVDRLTTVTELFTGAVPRSDSTATSTVNAIEQGAKTFTAIQQRAHRSLTQEVNLIKTLNSIYLDEYQSFMDIKSNTPKQEGINRDDYSDDIDIVLSTDPTVISQQQLLQRAEYVQQVIATNPFLAQDPQALALSTKLRLEAVGVPDYVVEAVSEIMAQSVAKVQQNLSQQQQVQDQMGEETLRKIHQLGATDAQIQQLEQQSKGE